MKNILHTAAAITALAIIATACDPVPPTIKPTTDAKITMAFAHNFGTEPIAISTGTYTNQAGNTAISVEKIKYFVDEITLIKTDGTPVNIAYTGLIDAEENKLKFEITAPAGSYKQVSLKIGLDATTNHADPASFSAKTVLHPSVHSDMYWSWNPGFIFFKVEGRYTKANATRSTYYYHIGLDENTRTYTFDKNFVIDGTNLTANFGLDISKFFGTHNFETGETTNSVGDSIIAPKLSNNMPAMLTLTDLK
jgi:hypothetical protein